MAWMERREKGDVVPVGGGLFDDVVCHSSSSEEDPHFAM
jgi:hypothetical protein